MQTNVSKIYLLILTALLSLSTFGSVCFAQGGCSKDCSQISKCVPARNGTAYKQTSSGNVINGKCVKEKTAGGCYDANPTSCSGSYYGLGYRPTGAGGNSTPRNHYGSDIGSAACGANKGKIQVYAPADGVVRWTGVSSGGGRTMVIEHEKKCSGGGKYKTIYRHLAAYIKTGGAVKKGEPVAIEGGSNCYSKDAGDACICDNKEQSVGKVYSGCSRIHAYKIHLHMETVNSKFSGSNYIGGEVGNILETSCGAVQTLCGGCAADTTSCGGKTEMSNDGTVASVDGISGGSEGGDFSGSGGGGYQSDTCNFREYLDSQNCTFCELFKKLFNAASIMAKTSNDTLASPTKTLVIIGFLIWICIYLLKHISSYSKIGTGEMLKGLLFQGFRVAVVIIALSGAIYELMDLTINPILETGLSFGRTLNAEASCDSSASYMQNIIGYDEKTGFPKPEEGTSSEIGGLSKHLGESIICNLKLLEDKTGFLMSLGKYSICIGWERHFIKSAEFLPGLGYFTTGALLWIVGILLLLSFPWCLVDCILQLCVAVALLPCAIGAYAFKITAQYLKMIWNMFMNAMFNFVFMAIIIYIINAHLSDWIGYTPGTYPAEDIFITAYQSYGIAWWGIGFLKIALVCLFCWSFFDEASSMANEFAKGMSMHNIGRKLGGTVSSAAVNKVVKPGAVIAGNVALGAGKRIGESINSNYGNSFRSGVNKFKGEIIKRLPARYRTETTNPDGTTSISASYSVLGFRQTRTITQDADGIWTQTKETHRETNYEKHFKRKVDENGNEYFEERKRFMGIRTGGTRAMKQRKDEATGRTIWETADETSGRKRQLVMDENGKILSFNTHAEDKNSKDQLAKENIGTRSFNDSFMRTKELTNEKGEVVGRDIKFNNTTSAYLVNEDGSINSTALDQIINGASDKERAYEGIMLMVAQKRGVSLNNRFQKRDVKINKDKSVTITQTNLNGTKQILHAKMVGNQMVTYAASFDRKGNPIRFQKSNGIRTLSETYEKQSDGTYAAAVRHGFSEHWTNRSNKILDEYGVWTFRADDNADAAKAMTGFDEQDYKEHIRQMEIERETKGDRMPRNYVSFDGLSQEDVMSRMGLPSDI